MARAFHRGYVQSGHRARQVTRLHIVREDGKWAGRQGLCGTSAGNHRKSEPMFIDPMPAVPPPGLRWCPGCIGQLAERMGALGLFAHALASVGAEGVPGEVARG